MSWLSRVLGRSLPSPKGTDSGNVIKLDGVEGESKPADHKGEIETHLTAEPDQSEGAFDAFLELDGIKGETEDRAAALVGGDPDLPIIIGSVPNPPVPGGPVPVPYPLAEDAASQSQALDIGGNETLTVGGARSEADAMPALHKSTDVTLKRGIVGDQQGPFDVKMEEVAPASGGGTVADDVIVDGRIITAEDSAGAAGDGTTEHFFTVAVKEGRVGDEEHTGSMPPGGAGGDEEAGLEVPASSKWPDITLKRGIDPDTEEMPRDFAAEEPGPLEVKLEDVRITSYQLGTLDSAQTGGDQFGFGVEREMKESGEKGGTEDINIGVGELQETTISKSGDSPTAPAELAGAEPSDDARSAAWNFENAWPSKVTGPMLDKEGEEPPGIATGAFDVKIEEVVAPGTERAAGSKEQLDFGLTRASSDPEEGGEISSLGIKLGRESSDPEEGGELSLRGIKLARESSDPEEGGEVDDGIVQHNETDLEFLARKAGGGQQEYLQVKMEDVIVTSVSPGDTGAAAQGGGPHELGHTLGLRHEHVRPESTEELMEEEGALDPAAADDGSIPTETLTLNFDKLTSKDHPGDAGPFGGFQGGVRVAAGDVNNDGADEELSSTLEVLEPEGHPDIAGNFRETAEGEMVDLDVDDLDLDLDDKDIEV